MKTKLLALALVLASTAHAAPPDDQQLARAVDAYCKPLVDTGHLAGTLLIARDGKILFEKSYGLADREKKIPAKPDTRFNIASITKPMTVVLANQLIEEKKLSYGDTLSRWIPEFPRAREITVGDLRGHSAGIPHRVTEKDEETKPTTAADMVRYAARHPLEFDPGTKSNYSSGGYSVFARVLELASGKSYGDLIDERLFKPLGMTHSVHPDARLPRADRVPSYIPGAKGFDKAPYEDLSFLVGAGSIYSTPGDLLKLVNAVASGALGPEVRADLVRGRGGLHWNGSTNGFRAFADWDSATGVTVVFAGNTHTGANDLLQRAVPRIVAGEPVEPPSIPKITRVKLDEAMLRRYEGVYELDVGSTLRLEVTAHDGCLWANDWALVPITDSTFFSPRDFGEVTVVRDAAGAGRRMDWKLGGRVYGAPRTGDVASRTAK